jgi:hypothetical protein
MEKGVEEVDNEDEKSEEGSESGEDGEIALVGELFHPLPCLPLLQTCPIPHGRV